MKNIYFGGMIVLLLLVSSCSNSGNSTNAGANSNRAAINTGTVTNTLGNAANTVANAVSNVTSTSSSPESFIKDAGMGGLAEVELGKLASTKATNPEVKKFAQQMVSDHSKANTELKALAGKKNITLPTELDSSHKSTLDSLSGKSGADFDKAYVDDMVDDHEKDVAEFERQSQNSTDPDVKAFAAKTLPTLKKHLDEIKAIKAKMK